MAAGGCAHRRAMAGARWPGPCVRMCAGRGLCWWQEGVRKKTRKLTRKRTRKTRKRTRKRTRKISERDSEAARGCAAARGRQNSVQNSGQIQWSNTVVKYSGQIQWSNTVVNTAVKNRVQNSGQKRRSKTVIGWPSPRFLLHGGLCGPASAPPSTIIGEPPPTQQTRARTRI